jgi:hypothetical protein
MLGAMEGGLHPVKSAARSDLTDVCRPGNPAKVAFGDDHLSLAKVGHPEWRWQVDLVLSPNDWSRIPR